MKVENELTANEAKVLSGPTLTQKVENLLEYAYGTIRLRCQICRGTDRPRRVILRSNVMSEAHAKDTPLWRKFRNVLTDRGFVVEAYDQDGKVGYDRGTVVSW